MIAITRKLEFDYGHRVLRHESKCRHIHGHRGVIEVTVTAPELDGVGRVIDFGVVKQVLGGWLDAHWDHNLLLHAEDPLQAIWQDGRNADAFGGKAPYVMHYGNPTAENMAREFFEVAAGLLPAPLKVVAIRCWETPNCYADYTSEG